MQSALLLQVWSYNKMPPLQQVSWWNVFHLRAQSAVSDKKTMATQPRMTAELQTSCRINISTKTVHGWLRGMGFHMGEELL